MRVGYIVALLMIVLMVGCATTQPEAAPEAPAEAPPAAPEAPAEKAAAAEEVVEEAETELTDAGQEHIDRLKPACERGAIQSCLVLKSKYGIEWPPEVVEEPETTEEAETTEEPEAAGETTE